MTRRHLGFKDARAGAGHTRTPKKAFHHGKHGKHGKIQEKQGNEAEMFVRPGLSHF